MKRTERDHVAVSARNLRLDAGLSQTEAAARMGVAPSFLCNLERRNTRPTATTLVRFLWAVDQDDLADRVKTAAGALAAVRGGREPRSPALLAYFESTGDETLASLMRAVTRV